MPGPSNGVYIVQGEMGIVLTAMRRGTRWSAHSHQDDDQDNLVRGFSDLKEVLNQLGDITAFDPNTFLGPFLDVIRSEDTTGPVTGLALSAINKFLSYGLIDPQSESASAALENVADAVTHARFVGTDPGSDEVVLMKILQVLRTLLLTPAGALLTNESICEIMQSCFRICFEMRLSELLRKSAEHALMDMVQLLFSRLPQFPEDAETSISLKKLYMRAGTIDTSRGKRKSRSPRPKVKKTYPKSDNSIHSQKESVAAIGIHVKEYPTSLQVEPQGESSSSVCGAAVETGSVDSADSGVLLSTPITPGSSYIDLHSSFQQGAETEKEGKGNVTTVEPTPVVVRIEGMAQSQEEDMSVVKAEEGSVKFEGEIHEEVDQGSLQEGNKDSHSTEDAAADSDVVQDKAIMLCTDTSEENLSLVESRISRKRQESLEPSGDDEEIQRSTKLEHQDYINPRGVRFTPQTQAKEGSGPLIPYGLPCVRELYRFLVSLINPLDKHNTEEMIHIGLSLLTVALETGADYIGNFRSLLTLVRDEMCRNLFSLMNLERLSIFAASLRICFLLFEALRSYLKFQLEMYLTRLIDIIISESLKIPYEQREIALESVVQLWRIPGLVTELFLNYDCDLYCSNLFEDLTKLLSKNAFPVSDLYSTHLLSLDALLTVIDSIENHCHSRILNEHQDDKEGEATEDSSDVSLPWKFSHSEQYTTFASGYLVGQQMSSSQKEQPKLKMPRKCRVKMSDNIPTHEQLMAIKHKKKLLTTGTEHFNMKPVKGIQFLQENCLFSTPLDPVEVVHFLKENPRLDKKMIGDYISNRKNLRVLESFVKSFEFHDIRVDEALRLYLETFRLPGEAPLISLLLEQFADHWHKCNGEPFASADAAFTLAYAVIMLNVDQHNYNVKKQNNPMTREEFKNNLRNVNGGNNFDQDMLDEIYAAIKNEEIVMPAEQTGLVKENYLWKVLLRRGTSKDGSFLHAPNGVYDHDLFSLIWGPTVAALSFVFDKSMDNSIVQRAISGFRKCAMISAHYGMSDVFDNLVISLCKFTTLLSSSESADNLTISFGGNHKAQLAARTVFNLAHRHGDILREGWKNLLDCLLQLFKCKLLPKVLVEAEDFNNPSGKINLIREEIPSQRTETGLFSSLYSYIAMTSESQSQKGPSPEDQDSIQRAQACIRECHPEQLVTESKFLRLDSLQELVKALIFASHGPDGHVSIGGVYDEDAAVFFLELLTKIVIQNRDRVNTIWQSVRDHMYSLIMGASASEHHFLMERAIVGLLRLAVQMMRREDMGPIVLQSLRMLLLLKPQTLFRVSRQVAYGLHELLKTNAANIHQAADWSVLFTLLECVGAGAKPPRIVGDGPQNHTDEGMVWNVLYRAQSDSELQMGHISDTTQDSGRGSDRGYLSDSEVYGESQTTKLTHTVTQATSPELASPRGVGGWILVGKEGEIEPVQIRPLPVNQYNIVHERELMFHDALAYVKTCESLSFLVRDVAHITPENFESCVHCIRTFVEASLNGGKHSEKKSVVTKENKPRKKSIKKREESGRMKRSQSTPQNMAAYDADESDPEDLPSGYHQVSIQLLDLMHTLHTRAAQIFQWWAAEGGQADCTSLWAHGWCPLLQGIARLCCDSRRQVRTSAVTYLQRALLVHDLQTLYPLEWEACFNKVLFPLLAKLLEPISLQDPVGLEETRMRAATLLCKVFLQHLNPLLSLPTFTALWLTILDFMDKYMHANKSDLLYEAVPESLKNMLLVMETAGIFQSTEDIISLWTITWDRIDTFLPSLRDELFKSHPPVEARRAEATSHQLKQDEIALSSSPSLDTTAEVSVPSSISEERRPSSLQESMPFTASQEVKAPATLQEAKESKQLVSQSPLTHEGLFTNLGQSFIIQPPLPTVATYSSLQQPAAIVSAPSSLPGHERSSATYQILNSAGCVAYSKTHSCSVSSEVYTSLPPRPVTSSKGHNVTASTVVCTSMSPRSLSYSKTHSVTASSVVYTNLSRTVANSEAPSNVVYTSISPRSLAQSNVVHITMSPRSLTSNKAESNMVYTTMSVGSLTSTETQSSVVYTSLSPRSVSSIMTVKPSATGPPMYPLPNVVLPFGTSLRPSPESVVIPEAPSVRPATYTTTTGTYAPSYLSASSTNTAGTVLATPTKTPGTPAAALSPVSHAISSSGTTEIVYPTTGYVVPVTLSAVSSAAYTPVQEVHQATCTVTSSTVSPVMSSKVLLQAAEQFSPYTFTSPNLIVDSEGQKVVPVLPDSDQVQSHVTGHIPARSASPVGTDRGPQELLGQPASHVISVETERVQTGGQVVPSTPSVTVSTPPASIATTSSGLCTPSMPLLLNPSLIDDATIPSLPIFSPQTERKPDPAESTS